MKKSEFKKQVIEMLNDGYGIDEIAETIGEEMQADPFDLVAPAQRILIELTAKE